MVRASFLLNENCFQHFLSVFRLLSKIRIYFFAISDFGVSLDMIESPRELNVIHAKEDFQQFLYSLFKMFKPKPNWRWLGFDREDASRMINDAHFVDSLLEESVSLKVFMNLSLLNFHEF